MDKYTELSNFEINKKVAEKLGEEWFVTTTVWDELVVMVGGKCFKPCDNPSDAMPIIIENLISLMADMSDGRGSTWWCASDISNSFTSNYKSNPLRAAMEVFLMIKDAENEG
ncbi:TPA: DUF2591 family protein [Proteus mirabilis]|uniref:DUF2591 domain-containing protein n=1 Tax=Proteus mirabilis TaxID=584 RepID=UPI002182201C|nr:DUF2591 domain-containing protein [Proteus mirabilis]MCT0258693.1 DUF2591 domain-containing protein [Proteus mirabilis]HEK0413805.1 DUF2591 family protein [Proteus mirabilis]HEK0608168.1 DUF2591 family protein [Proteus mirabilis]HEK2812257.1 DUF2591 family protein [Proteus mirabilis]HEK2830206.1 DUF2591 family protein [Proteus mirabilis]